MPLKYIANLYIRNGSKIIKITTPFFSPSEQIYVLNKREKIVRHAWKIEDYIKFTQIYTDKSTFTHWIQTQIQEDSNISTASKNTNKPKAKKT